MIFVNLFSRVNTDLPSIPLAYAATEFGAEKPEGLTSVVVGAAKEKGAEIAGSLPGAGVVKL